VSFDWPFDAAEDTKLSTMISIFSKSGYEECTDSDIEEGFRKIALYGTEDKITHTARQLVSGKNRGKWTIDHSYNLVAGKKKMPPAS